MSVSPSAEQYRDAFRASPVASLLLDLTLRIIDVNAAFYRMSGTTAAHVLGHDLLEVVRIGSAGTDETDHLTAADAISASIERVRTTGSADRVVDMPWTIRHHDRVPDRRIWHATTTAVPNDVGDLTLLLHQVDDVTESVATRREADSSDRTEHARLVEEVNTAQESLILRAEQLQRLNEQLQHAGHHDRSVAQALQSSLLAQLPTAPHLQLAARYLTAAGTDQVGGDWYDAYVAPNADVTFTIGDVMGHDIVAAGLMGQLRNVLRALVVDRNESPAQLLSRLDRALQRLHVDTLATAALLAATPDGDGGWTLRWSNAGHPAPMLLSPDGVVELLDGARSALLGVRPDITRADLARHVASGSVLLLYTDGLIETRNRDLDDGKARLAQAAAHHHRLAPGQFLDAVLADMVGGQPEDDVAVLAVRFSAA